MASMFFLLPLHREHAYRHAVMRDFWARWKVDQWKDARANPGMQFLAKSLRS